MTIKQDVSGIAQMSMSGLGGAADFALTARNFRFAAIAVNELGINFLESYPTAVIRIARFERLLYRLQQPSVFLALISERGS